MRPHITRRYEGPRGAGMLVGRQEAELVSSLLSLDAQIITPFGAEWVGLEGLVSHALRVLPGEAAI